MSEQQESEIQEETEAGKDTFFSDAPIPVQEVQKKGMSKNIKGLIAAVAALLVVGCALTIVILTNQNEEHTSSIDVSSLANEFLDDEEKSILINPEKAEDVKEVQIANADQFTVCLQSEATEETKAVYTIKGYEDMILDTGLLSTLVNNGSELSALQLIEENAENLDKYGLENPAARVKLSYQDGNDFSFSVGNVSPMDSSQNYCEANGNVYLVKSSLMANYQKSAIEFVSKTILEKPADDNYPIVESLRIERENLDYDIYMEYAYDVAEDTSVGGTAATHAMKEPVFSYLNVEKSADVTNGMFGLTAVEISKIRPTEEDLSAAGMDAPFCTVTMCCDDGNQYILHFGNQYTTQNGTEAYYTYLEGTNMLYGVALTRAVWTTVQPGDITSANIFGTNVWNIATLDVSGNGQELHFVGEGDRDTYTVTKNGEPCDKERFRLLYKFFLYIYGEELYIDAQIPQKDPDAEVHLTTQDGKDDYTIAFYKLTDLNSVITVNGTPTYKIRTSCIDTIWHNIEIFDDPEQEFTMTWQ